MNAEAPTCPGHVVPRHLSGEGGERRGAHVVDCPHRYLVLLELF